MFHDNHNDDLYTSDEFMITSMLVKFKSSPALFSSKKINENVNLQSLPIFEINRLTNLLGFGVKL